MLRSILSPITPKSIVMIKFKSITTGMILISPSSESIKQNIRKQDPCAVQSLKFKSLLNIFHIDFPIPET